MDLVKLGKKGQVTIPKAILKQAGIAEDAPLLIAAAPDGSIVLRPAGVYPIEIYTDERIAEFERENAIPTELSARVEKLAGSRRKKSR
ncbi:MAG: AbrB/MazE/SpoVT family DNA-binding domain-containing protein [Burkholderiales bacterium]